MFRIGFIIVLIITYASAAMLSSHVSMDLMQTDWTNLWTYFWWAVSLPVIGVLAFLVSWIGLLVWNEIQ